MSRSVDDVDFGISVHYGTVLGINCNSSFSLYVIAVHDTVDYSLVVSEYTALIEECIDKC